MNVLNSGRKLPAKIPPLTTDLLLLPDGRVLVRNLTPVFAKLLQDLNLPVLVSPLHASRITHHVSGFTPR